MFGVNTLVIENKTSKV